MRRFSEFGKDERAFGGWDVLQIALLLIVPIGLVIFWVKYLRRIQADENAKNGPWTWGNRGGSMAQQQSLGDQKRQCNKCGLMVRPPRGSGPPVCPNCMSVL